MQRIAIIGSGATALAVLGVTSTVPEARVALIRPGKQLIPHRLAEAGSSRDRDAFAETIRALRGDLGFRFPPPKTHFGELPDTAEVNGWGRIWKSNLHGGLTQFWGGSMLPFTDRELGVWPLRRCDLEAEYSTIAEQVGITGAADSLRAYFDDKFARRAPLDAIAPIKLFIDRLAYNKRAAFDILAGVGRVAVETRPERANACTYSGDCMTGCTRGSVFSALPSIQKHLQSDPSIEEHIGTANRIDFERKIVHVRSPEGSESSCPYDLLFVCAGAIQSVELLTRSLGGTAESPIVDNTILSFPVFYTGPIPSKSVGDGYFALTNGTLILRPHTKTEPAIQIQLYPNPDYFWQYNLPSWSWRALQPLVRCGRNRLFWARAYLPGSQSQHYQMRLEKDGVQLRLERDPETSPFLANIWPELRKAITHAGFWVPPVQPFAAKTSSHYAGGFPMGGRIVDRDGCMGNGAHLCDSTNFPTSPSASPTLTAMANARRIARIALA